jgi:predicted enzyme related to lactoylglutathione lyase
MMSDTQHPGTVYWIDHYVVGTDDIERWTSFQEKVVGSRAYIRDGRDGQPGFLRFQEITSCCHHGAMKSPTPLPPSAGLGKGLPRYGLYIRQQDVDKHLKRLDEHGVRHLDAIRTAVDGDEGISIQWEDPDANQFEFWAPDRLPEGAMDEVTPLGVGRISHGVFASQDLQRAADHFATYCGLEPARDDVSSDTLVLRTVGGARIIYKKVDKDGIDERTGGFGKLQAAHAALVLRDEDFWPNYDRMWDGVSEWAWDRESGQFIGAGPDLPARTSRHGSPAGRKFYEVKGRGDDWYDWDTNCFHFMGGVPTNRSFSAYEPHTMEWHLPQYLEQQGRVAS